MSDQVIEDEQEIFRLRALVAAAAAAAAAETEAQQSTHVKPDAQIIDPDIQIED